MSDALTKVELNARYGSGARLPDDVDGEVLVFLHVSQEAAEAYATGNSEHHGHPSHAELRDCGWVNVVDLRPAIAEIDARFKESEATRV